MCDCKKMTNIRYATVERAHLAYLLFCEYHTHTFYVQWLMTKRVRKSKYGSRCSLVNEKNLCSLSAVNSPVLSSHRA